MVCISAAWANAGIARVEMRRSERKSFVIEKEAIEQISKGSTWLRSTVATPWGIVGNYTGKGERKAKEIGGRGGFCYNKREEI